MLLRIITVLISVTSHIVDQSGSDQIGSERDDIGFNCSVGVGCSGGVQ